MNDITPNDFVEYADTGSDGKWAAQGRVLSINEKTQRIEIDCVPPYGIINVPLNKGLLTRITAPEGFVPWPQRTRVLNTPQVEAKVRRATKTKKFSEKQLKVIDLVRLNPEMSRKQLIDLVVKETEMSANGASTYVAAAKRYLEGNA